MYKYSLNGMPQISNLKREERIYSATNLAQDVVLNSPSPAEYNGVGIAISAHWKAFHMITTVRLIGEPAQWKGLIITLFTYRLIGEPAQWKGPIDTIATVWPYPRLGPILLRIQPIGGLNIGIRIANNTSGAGVAYKKQLNGVRLRR